MVSYVGDEDFAESFLGKNKAKKAARQEKRAAKKTARIEKRVEKKTARIEKRSEKKAGKLLSKAAKAKNPGRAAVLTARADRKIVKADNRIAKKGQVGENRTMNAEVRKNVKVAKISNGGGLFNRLTTGIVGAVLPGMVDKKPLETSAPIAPTTTPSAPALEEVRNPVNQVANLSTPLTPTTSIVPTEPEMGDMGADFDMESLDQPTSGWDEEAQAVSDAENAAANGGYEDEGYEEEGYEEEGYEEEGYEEDMYEEELSFVGKTAQEKKKNQKVLLTSLIALIVLCLLVWFITKYLKKK
ncbi:hypothetical protein Q0590_25155 [Rhodocytophaga aerolata]|uniref:Uncharacterized protein n=1 Tax=Rhodocytophaga aerolata TaxID=455078 RepID=A0ABT8RFM3_9BACT|nr:hypothetical protein [Rhodocytophaga aerolata]MDO1449590.1 hypothetical protein [Rhodocytophaga aerolata]